MSVVAVILIIVLTVGSYLAYVFLQYSRIEEGIFLDITNNQTAKLQVGQEYSALTYNVGFGAYDQEYSFFLDSGTTVSGQEITGEYGKAVSYESARKNTDGSLYEVELANADIVLLQEVDEKANRSYFIDQVEEFTSLDGYGSTYAENFHSAYFLYPFNDPIGASNSGLVTLSKYNISTAVRYSLPVTDDAISKLFDLDRCFSLQRMPVVDGEETKELVLINIHMSAYDAGGTIRTSQLKLLNETFKAELEKGNYVIAGGDYNHDLAETAGKFETQFVRPDWVSTMKDSDLASGMRIVADGETPTCRSSEIAYTKGINYTVTVDGFLVSDNITAVASNIDIEFLYSDHNPAKLIFTLN